MVDIVTADTVTRLDRRHRDRVVIAGSHGGVYPGYLAAKAGVRAVILNDAGVGKDRAGLGSLAYLDALGLPAATASHQSARIGDGGDMAARGVISHVNEAAARLGCAPGQACRECAARMRVAAPWRGEAPHYAEARVKLRAEPGEPEVWGLDSASLILPADEGRIIVTASHGALLGGRPDDAIKTRPLAALFNDAGVGIDRIGISRLPVLDEMGVIGATVDYLSARIGDARSAWATGVISHVNDAAREIGGEPGLTTRDFAQRVIAALNP